MLVDEGLSRQAPPEQPYSQGIDVSVLPPLTLQVFSITLEPKQVSIKVSPPAETEPSLYTFKPSVSVHVGVESGGVRQTPPKQPPKQVVILCERSPAFVQLYCIKSAPEQESSYVLPP